MVSKKKKRTMGRSHGARNGVGGSRTVDTSRGAVLSVVVGLVSIALAVVVGARNVFQPTSSSSDPPSQLPPKQPVIDEAFKASRAAELDPLSIQKAEAAARANFIEGRIRNATHWNVQTCVRQLHSNGAVKDMTHMVQPYGLLHLVQHLEVNAVLWARILLQLGPAYGQQLEQHCQTNSDALSRSLWDRPTRVHRSLVTNVLASCVVAEDAFRRIQGSRDKSTKLSMQGQTIAHFLAHFGDAALVRYAKATFPLLDWTLKDGTGRSPTRIAAARGFLETASLINQTISYKDETPHTIMEKRTTQLVATNGATGGWGGASHLETGSCDFTVVDGGSASDEEILELMSNEVPLLVRNKPGNTFKTIQKLLTKKSMASGFANMKTTVSEVPYQGAKTTTVHTYAQDFEDTTDYLFQSLPQGHPLREKIESHFPSWAGSSSRPAERQVQLAIGPAGSGAPPHYHKAALNTLYFGHKKWYLMPPRDAVYSSESAAAWVDQGLEESRKGGGLVLECNQRPGDVVFIPDFWGHATINLEPSVAVASEFVTPRMEFEISVS